ncbi:hypothetical protein EV121DRAFT_297870 [Schizophyllum commune]
MTPPSAAPQQIPHQSRGQGRRPRPSNGSGNGPPSPSPPPPLPFPSSLPLSRDTARTSKRKCAAFVAIYYYAVQCPPAPLRRSQRAGRAVAA